MSVNEMKTKPADVKFAIQPGSNDRSATFIFGDEDHTLGNALRHVLMQRKETEFCGYSVPHPSEPKMNLRLQTMTKGATALGVLKAGLEDLEKICGLIDSKIETALQRPPGAH